MPFYSKSGECPHRILRPLSSADSPQPSATVSSSLRFLNFDDRVGSLVVLLLPRMRVQDFTYKDAGVDVYASSDLVKRIAKMAPGIGGDTILVAGTDFLKSAGGAILVYWLIVLPLG